MVDKQNDDTVEGHFATEVLGLIRADLQKAVQTALQNAQPKPDQSVRDSLRGIEQRLARIEALAGVEQDATSDTRRVFKDRLDDDYDHPFEKQHDRRRHVSTQKRSVLGASFISQRVSLPAGFAIFGIALFVLAALWLSLLKFGVISQPSLPGVAAKAPSGAEAARDGESRDEDRAFEPAWREIVALDAIAATDTCPNRAVCSFSESNRSKDGALAIAVVAVSVVKTFGTDLAVT
jgi:hypothetical protein